MVRQLKSKFPQVKRLKVLQYLNHSYAKVLSLSIFQFLTAEVPFLCTCLISSIQVPILHFTVSKEPPRHKMFLRNKSGIIPTENYCILIIEHYQFDLGNLVKIFLSQEDLEIAFPISVLKNPHRIYPTNKLKLLKGYSGARIPRLKSVLSNQSDVLTKRQFARNANCKANQNLIKASLHFVEMLLSMTAKDKLRYQWGHSWADFPLSSSSSEKREICSFFSRTFLSREGTLLLGNPKSFFNNLFSQGVEVLLFSYKIFIFLVLLLNKFISLTNPFR